MNATDRQIGTAITQRAAEWFAAHRGGALDESERGAFLAWLKASPIHVEEYLGVAALARMLPDAVSEPHLSIEALVALAERDRNDKVAELHYRFAGADVLAERKPSAAPWWLGVAVTLVIGTATAGMLFGTRAREWLGWPSTYETALGALQTRQLSDGSVLHLDTGSAVTVRFSHRERVVKLDRGQAYFQVAHDSGRPFRVIAGDASALAVGTAFDVYRRSDGTQVTVVTGRVRVARSAGAGAAAVEVNAGQQAQIPSDTAATRVTAVDVERAIAWMQHKIAFDHTPLAEVASEFNRYHRLPFVIEGPQLRELPVSGVFDASDQESFAAFLASLEGVRVTRSAESIEVRSARRPAAPSSTHPAR